MTAMTKLSESMVKHQEAVTRAQEERKDTRLKAWTKLSSIQKNIIILARVDEQGSFPTEPTDEMLSIFGCSNAGQVDQYVNQLLLSHNVSLEPGLCSSINKEIMAQVFED